MNLEDPREDYFGTLLKFEETIGGETSRNYEHKISRTDFFIGEIRDKNGNRMKQGQEGEIPVNCVGVTVKTGGYLH